MSHPPRTPDVYRHWTEERVRFADLDPLGHVNNAATTVFLESARVQFARDVGIGVWDGPLLCVIASLTVNYHDELHYPARLRIGSGVTRIGTRSFTLVNAVFVEGEAPMACPVTGETPVVLLDQTTRKPAAIPEDLRAQLKAHLLPAV